RITSGTFCHQSTARKSVGRDLRCIETLIVGTARLIVFSDGQIDIRNQGLAHVHSVRTHAAAACAVGDAVRNDEISVRRDLCHDRLVTKSILLTASLSPRKYRVLLVAAKIHGSIDGAFGNPRIRVELDNDLVRSG